MQKGNRHTCGRTAHDDCGAAPETNNPIAARCDQHQLDYPALWNLGGEQTDECSGATDVHQLAAHRVLTRQSEPGAVRRIDAWVTSAFTRVGEQMRHSYCLQRNGRGPSAAVRRDFRQVMRVRYP